MIYKEIVNHTKVAITFEMGGIPITIGSKGAFNLNHAYDFEEQCDVLRIVEEEFICDIAKNLGRHNFIPLSALLNQKNAKCKLYTGYGDSALHIGTVSGLGATNCTVYNCDSKRTLASDEHMYVFTMRDTTDSDFYDKIVFEFLVANCEGVNYDS